MRKERNMNQVTFVAMRDNTGAMRWEMRVGDQAMAYWYDKTEYEKASDYLARKFKASGTRVTYITDPSVGSNPERPMRGRR
jgi:hypothetical protein